MKKSLILTSLLAIVATGAAKAETDVTFGGNYDLLTATGDVQSDPGVVTTAPADLTYGYDVTDGRMDDINYAEAPDVTKFTFVGPDGTTHDVSFENRYGKSDYVGTTAVTGAGYDTTQIIVAGANVSESNYSYTYTSGGENIERTLDNPSRFIGEMTALSENYANAISVNVVNGEAFVNGDTTALTNAGDLDYTLYGFTLGDSYYNLDKEGDSFILVRNGEKVTPASGSELETEFNNAQAAYATDVTTLGTNIATTASNWATEKTYYDTAKGFFNADVATVATLNNNYDSQDKADDLYRKAQITQGVAQENQNKNIANHNAAVELYNAPIEATITNGANNAITTALDDNGAIKLAIDDAKSYADNGDEATLASAKSYADSGDEATLASAKSYADSQDASTLNAAKAYADAGNALTLNQANAYTDAKVDTLEKNVSGGIAAATALSAVEVSNVKRGEMSVGGGYGYYNGQSAGAFGMAMGLSDNWSVNAGAGIASGDETQVAFRAGTNYKFKLF